MDPKMRVKETTGETGTFHGRAEPHRIPGSDVVGETGGSPAILLTFRPAERVLA
jgi:hypothetical protein